jgi:hypothetical protein
MGQWFSAGTLVSSTNITEILLKSGIKNHKPKQTNQNGYYLLLYP